MMTATAPAMTKKIKSPASGLHGSTSLQWRFHFYKATAEACGGGCSNGSDPVVFYESKLKSPVIVLRVQYGLSQQTAGRTA